MVNPVRHGEVSFAGSPARIVPATPRDCVSYDGNIASTATSLFVTDIRGSVPVAQSAEASFILDTSVCRNSAGSRTQIANDPITKSGQRIERGNDNGQERTRASAATDGRSSSDRCGGGGGKLPALDSGPLGGCAHASAPDCTDVRIECGQGADSIGLSARAGTIDRSTARRPPPPLTDAERAECRNQVQCCIRELRAPPWHKGFDPGLVDRRLREEISAWRHEHSRLCNKARRGRPW